MYFVYILTSANTTLYTGITNNLDRRILQHNGMLKGGAKCTRGKQPHEYVYVESCASKSVALKREIEIKKLSRAKKLSLISDSKSANTLHPKHFE
jgi:putative endonuclease